MATAIQTLSSRVFATLKSYGLNIIIFDDSGNKVFEPQEARAFFSLGGDIAVWINIISSGLELKVFVNSPEDKMFTDFDLLTNLRITATKYKANFNVSRYGGTIEPKNFAFMANSNVNESVDMKGSTKSSYQKIGNTKLIIRHTDQIDPEKRGARSRKIKAIFIETKEGERLKYPHNNLPSSRAMCRHISLGGLMNDTIGEGIIKLYDNILHMKQVSSLVSKGKPSLTETELELKSFIRECIINDKKIIYKFNNEKLYETACQELTEKIMITEGDQDVVESIKNICGLQEEDNEYDATINEIAARMHNQHCEDILTDSSDEAYIEHEDELLENWINSFDIDAIFSKRQKLNETTKPLVNKETSSKKYIDESSLFNIKTNLIPICESGDFIYYNKATGRNTETYINMRSNNNWKYIDVQRVIGSDMLYHDYEIWQKKTINEDKLWKLSLVLSEADTMGEVLDMVDEYGIDNFVDIVENAKKIFNDDINDKIDNVVNEVINSEFDSDTIEYIISQIKDGIYYGDKPSWEFTIETPHHDMPRIFNAIRRGVYSGDYPKWNLNMKIHTNLPSLRSAGGLPKMLKDVEVGSWTPNDEWID